MSAIHVVNPNSLGTVTAAIARAITAEPGEDLRCHTSSDGPPGIHTDAELAAAIPPLLALAMGLKADALVVACFGDPGVDQLRTQLDLPVIGIQEAAAAEAISAGQHFGILAVADASVLRHRRSLAARGQDAAWVGSRPLGMPVRAFADAEQTWQRLVDVGRALRDDDGAEALILGCAGLADHRALLEDHLGVPVIEPCQAGLRAARGALVA